MVRARLFALMFGVGAAAVAACGNSADDDALLAGAGHPSGSGGAAGASTSHGGKNSAGGAATGASGSGGAGSGTGGGASGGTTGGSAGSNSAGTSFGTGATSGASSSGAGKSGAGSSGRAGRGGGSGSSGAGRGGTAGHGGAPTGAAGEGDAGTSSSAGGASGSDYDATVLADGPVLYLAMNGTSKETDLTGNGHDGTYQAGAPARAALPNADDAADFDGVKQYLTVPSAAVLSIPTKHLLTWEAWIRPDVLQFPHDTSDGYVDWMGKCAEYSPTCEWEARLYSATNSEDRCNRLSAYAFNPDGNLGSGAFWQQTDCGTSIQANAWYHIVGEYTTLTQPSSCGNTDTYPGSIDLWVNGINWHQAGHGDTGCMSQYQIIPAANDSPLNIGTMAHDSWFQGAIGKVAIYDKLLSDSTITHHYTAMTGKAPTGSCSDTCSF